MNKNKQAKVVVPQGQNLFYGDYDLNTTPPAPKIKSVEPTGSQILVELLTSQELLGTSMIVNDNTAANAGAPQGYVLKLGPTLNADNWGIKVGSRVLLQGSFVPVPKYNDNKRSQGLVEIHAVKALLEESE
jgi:hypothetical protein